MIHHHLNSKRKMQRTGGKKPREYQKNGEKNDEKKRRKVESERDPISILRKQERVNH